MSVTITNTVITSTYTLSSQYQNPLVVTSTGTIEGNYAGISNGNNNSIFWTISNSGVIQSTNTGGGTGIILQLGGGVITNNSTGLVSGANSGIFVTGTHATVVNFGTVAAGQEDGVYLNASSLGSATLINAGTILATGSYSNGVRINIGTVENSGLISGHQGIQIPSGTIINSGTVAARDQFGIAINFNGQAPQSGHSVTNTSTGLITGPFLGINNGGGGGATVVNLGTVVGRIDMGPGGEVVNGSSLYSSAKIIGGISTSFTGALKVTNFGSIIGSSFGISLPLGSSGTIANFGTIAGATGIQEPNPGGGSITLTNAGSIIGTSGTAVLFGQGNDRLILQQGFNFIGGIDGNYGTDTVELDGSAGPLVVDYNGLGLSHFEAVLFETGNNNEVLKIGNNIGTLGITISDFNAHTEIIDLTAIGTDGTISSFDTVANRITVGGSLGSVTLQLDGTHGTQFTTQSDGVTGTDLIACFLRGTRIRTPDHDMPVEELAIGNQVITASGDAKPIKWIGRRAYDPRFIAKNEGVLPIRIEAGALAEDVPARDLWISPEHSLCIDGVLVQVKDLLNGATITQSDTSDEVEYFHIELDQHDIIFAEGAAVETFTDCDNRLMFQNGSEFARLYPDDDSPRWKFCLPRLETGCDRLIAIRATLLNRAKRVGYGPDTEPELHLVVDDIIIHPEIIDDLLYRFVIPAGNRSVWLASRNTVPAEIIAAGGDRRRLGVAVEHLTLRDADLSLHVPHNHPALRQGFHDDEGTHRWTNGWARIPHNLFEPLRGLVTLDLKIASRLLEYRVRQSRQARPHYQTAPAERSGSDRLRVRGAPGAMGLVLRRPDLRRASSG